MGNRRASGGLIGKSNKTSGGGNAVTRFNASGTFQVQSNTTAVDVLTVAGGGGGGNTPGQQGGGGGAGGFRNFTNQVVAPGSAITITVGAGGAVATAGADSVFANPVNPITSDSGGLGGSGGNPAPGPAAGTGGSGGGGGWNQTGAAGNTPPTSPAQGTAGGNGQITNVSNMRGGAGGGGSGSTAVVGVGDPSPKGPTNKAGGGGDGAPSTITGTNTLYAGGGGGGALNSSSSWATLKGGGGADGGGTGAVDSTAASTGDANTGSGGGGNSSPGAAAAGGSGVVIVKELDKAQGVFDMKSQFNAHTKGQWPTRTGVDDISNSIRFDDGSSPRLGFTPSGEGSRTTWTWSGWVKRGQISATYFRLFTCGPTSSQDDNNFIQITLKNTYTLQFSSWTEGIAKITSAVLRDSSAWYHIVGFLDTTNATASNRMGIYINGSRITSFATSTDPSQNYLAGIGLTNEHTLGSDPSGGNYFDGYLADINFIDGQALHAGHFGEPDPDCPQIWRPKKYYGTYGTNGFHLEFKQSGVGSGSTSTVGADTSGNLNHLTSTNVAATDQSTDTPTNNFCTLNPLIKSYVDGTLSEGNLKLVSGNSAWGHRLGTMAVANGKWYYEAKVTSATGSSYVGWQDLQPTQTQIAINAQSDSSGTTIWYTNTANDTTGHLRKNDSDDTAVTNAAIANGETVSIALDLDSSPQTITIYKDGVSVDADNTIASGNTGTLIPFISNATSGASIELNFGSPPYTISSGNADENGYGNFEYAVPSGFYALCSKNLAQYG